MTSAGGAARRGRAASPRRRSRRRPSARSRATTARRGGRGAGRSRRRARARSPRACPACRDRARRGGEQRVDVADAQHLADLGRPVGGGERHHQRADAARGQPRDHPLLAVREEQADRGCPCPCPPRACARASRRDSSSACAYVMCRVGRDDEVVVGPVRRPRAAAPRRWSVGTAPPARPAPTGAVTVGERRPPPPRPRRRADARVRARWRARPSRRRVGS